MMFQFASLNDFFAMAGHGGYVWACYIITALALITVVYLPYRNKSQLFVQLKRQQRLENQQ
ncbi:MAG: heme exporter protein D [Kiritimatiellia bacterium]|jgi:heme exporter protein D